VATGIQVSLNGGTLTTGENINATTTDLSLTNAPTSVNATGTINTTGTTGTGSTFSGNSAATTTLTVNNTNGANAPALAVGQAFTSAGNSTVGTNAGTTNTFGNGGGNTLNLIGNNSTAATTTQNTIGVNSGSGTVNNTFGNEVGTGPVNNAIGVNGGTNTVTNNIGNGNSTGISSNFLGAAINAGATVNNTIGTAVAGATANNTIGSTTGTILNTIIGTTNVNTVGSANTTVGNPANTAGQVAAFNGTVTMTATGQATDELTISNTTATGGQWNERITSAPTAGASQALVATTAAIAGQNATAGRFTSTSGANLIGLQSNVSGGTGTNTGVDVTSTGSSSIGVRVNSGAVTGINVDASNAVTGNGLIISQVQTNDNGENINFAANVAAGVGNANGINIDMANAKLGNVNGIRILNNADATSNAINISTSNGTGVNVTMTSAGTGMTVSGVGSASGITVSGIGAGVGIQTSAPASGTGIKTIGDGTAFTTALEVNAGNVKATGAGNGTVGTPSNRFADTYVLSVGDKAATSFNIYNSLVKVGSSVIITGMSNGGVVGVMTASAIVAGQFTVNTTAASFAGIDNMFYEIINH